MLVQNFQILKHQILVNTGIFSGTAHPKFFGNAACISNRKYDEAIKVLS